jgi:outer membrane biosynthesis protein TonB
MSHAMHIQSGERSGPVTAHGGGRGYMARDYVMGVATVLLTHVALPWAGWMLAHSLAAWLGEPRPPEPEARRIIAAEFVKLGKPFDPRKLPDRIAPRLTAPPTDEVAASQTPQDVPPPDASVPPEKTTPELRDSLAELGARAKEFAEVNAPNSEEGSPEGSAEGQVSTAQLGDEYIGRVVRFIREGWRVPSTIAPQELSGLSVEVDVFVTRQGHIGQHHVTRSSGNPLFDQSVVNRLDELRVAQTPLPEPPSEVAAEILNATVGMTFRGKDARN